MAADPPIRIRSWVRGSDADVRDGLLGYLSLFYGALVLDGITLRRTAEGRLTLSFPERRGRGGQVHCYVWPIDAEARRKIEKAVFGAAAAMQGAEW